jgi:hypothetical protein
MSSIGVGIESDIRMVKCEGASSRGEGHTLHLILKVGKIVGRQSVEGDHTYSMHNDDIW